MVSLVQRARVPEHRGQVKPVGEKDVPDLCVLTTGRIQE